MSGRCPRRDRDGCRDVRRTPRLAGKTVFSAKKRVVELLRASGELEGDPKPFTHAVKFYEKGDRPLEIVSTRQWYVRNGARDAALRDKLIALGAEMSWHPEFMRVRYENWVDGLTGDWLVSRQRFFGVPIPVWYGLDENGDRDYSTSCSTADPPQLPVDPTIDVPPGYPADQRGVRGRFRGREGHLRHLGDLIARRRSSPAAGNAMRSCGTSSHRSTCARRDRTSSGPGSSRRCCAARSRTTARRGRMPRSRASSSTPTARRCPSRRATSSRPPTSSSSTARTRCATGRPQSRLGTDAAFDPQNPTQIKIGRRLAIKVLNAAEVRAVVPRPRGRLGHPRARRVDAHDPRRRRARGDEGASRRTTTRARSR